MVAASGSQGSQPGSREAGRSPADSAALPGALKLAAAVLFSPRCLLLAWAWLSARVPLVALVWALLMGAAIKLLLSKHYQRIVARLRRNKSVSWVPLSSCWWREVHETVHACKAHLRVCLCTLRCALLACCLLALLQQVAGH